jgi:hypothetical protein
MNILEQQHEQTVATDAVPVPEEQQERAPLFRRYAIAVNADVHVGAVPLGSPTIGY